MTIYGLYARDTDGWFSIAALIKLMAELGVEEPAVRSAISRLKLRGLLESGRAGGAAGYGLSAGGRKILADGDRRIFRRPRASIDDGWLLAVFSVPEHERARRHALRSRLAWLGFGTVSAGVWIAPAQLAEETRDVLGRRRPGGLREPVHGRLPGLWRRPGQDRPVVGPGPAGAALPGVHRLGRAGPGALAAALAAIQGQAFADYVRVLTAWRRLPFLDPGLPPELLPPDWHGARAADLFGQLHDRLSGPAREHVLAVTA